MFLYFRRFFCLIRFGKPAEDNDASALYVLREFGIRKYL